MRRALLIWPLLAFLAAQSAFAEARLSVLVDVIRLHEAAEILSQEGFTHAEQLNAELLDGQGGLAFQAQVAQIYDPRRMTEKLRAALGAELQDAALEGVIEFYASEFGTQIISLENSARVVMQEPEAEAAARLRYLEQQESAHPRLDLIARYITSGDLVSRNLSSQLNAELQLLRGLRDGGAIALTEEEMVDQASSDIGQATEEITDWLNTYFLLAYDPLTDAEFEAYIAFNQTEPGRIFNRALFAGFEDAYREIYYALGRALSLNMQAEEL